MTAGRSEPRTLTRVDGSIALSFNFGAGTLSGSISPILHFGTTSYGLTPLSFTNSVFAQGSTTFSGQLATSLSGVSAFSGRFNRPAAQELTGSFAVPYTSQGDRQVYQATGGFVGKH